MRVVEIPEIGEGPEVRLGPEERRALVTLRDRLAVEWLDEGRARVSSRGYVGTVRLSANLTLSVRTKVPVANVLGLASLAYRSLPLPEAVGEAALGEGGPLDWLAFLLVFEAEALVARHLRQGYVDVEQELPYVRGRIRFGSAVREWTRPGLLVCEVSDFLPDTPENRVLRATLEALASSRLLPGLRRRVLEVASWLSGVTLLPASRRLLEPIRWTRLNAHYRPTIELCRLFLEGRGVEEPTGPVLAPAFLFPMERIFEAAVANHLRGRFPGVRVQPEHRLDPVRGFPDHRLTFRPDAVVDGTSEGPRCLVIDTKWADPELRTRFGGHSFRNHDLYQIAFYALSLGGAGLLVYPKTRRDVWARFEVRGVQLAVVTVDLTLPDLGGLRAIDGAVEDLLGSRR
jgi:5-methylcytosine-specific restriction enzyme subunit McrC